MRLPAFLFLLLCSPLAFAQTFPIRINLTVTPPYPVSVSYYADHPQQVLVQVINQSRTEQSFRLVGSINGLDNNVKIVSKDRGASGVITLNALESRLLSVTEIQDLFDATKLVFSGINYRQSQIDDGLPEGLYQVCAYAVDAVQTNVPKAEQTCSNAFPVTNLEPPIIIQPMADAEIKAMPVQNVLFTWTLPASAPPTTEYTLRMVEVIPGMNPNNALQAATTPIFFERTVKFNTLLYGPADPPLVAGRKYAFMITATDPMQKAVFRNGGRSAVQVFTYGAVPPATAYVPGMFGAIPPKEDEKIYLTNLSNLNTTVSGRLVYAFPENYEMEAFKETDANYGNKVPWKESSQSVRLKKSNFSSQQKPSPHGGILNSEYILQNLKPTAGTLPLKNVKVSLVRVYAFGGSSNDFYGPSYDAGQGMRIITGLSGTDMLDFKLNGKNIDNEPLGKVLATATTNSNGEYTFSFTQKDTCRTFNEFHTESYQQKDQYSSEKVLAKNPGPNIQKCLILVVESPYFCSPFVRLFPYPGDKIVLPELTSLAKTFQSRVYAINDASLNQAGGGEYATLEGINMEIFRLKPTDPLMPREEGQNLPSSSINSLQMGDYAQAYPVSQVERVVASGKTNGQGFFTVPRLFRGFGSPFIVHAYTNKNTGVYTKTETVKDISESGKNDFPSQDKSISPYLIFNAGFQYERSVTSLEMVSKKPRILGKVVELTKGLPGVKVWLLNNKKSKPGEVINTAIINGVYFNLAGSMTTDKDGYFEFNDLEVADYNLYFLKDGYNERYFKIDDNGNPAMFPMQMGQQVQVGEIQLQPSALLTGRTIDEDGNAVVCDIQVEDGAFYKTDEITGAFEMPAASGTKRSVKIFPRSDEYFDETYKITIEKQQGKMVNSAGNLLVYRRRHRIRFVVQAAAELKPGQPANLKNVAGAMVEVKGIKQKTDANGVAEFSFESPGEKFLVRVKPEKGSNLSHFEEEIAIPIGKKPVSYGVTLQPGRILYATVQSIENGKKIPLAGAKVYIKQLNNVWDDNPANYTEAITNEVGRCDLTGIPLDEDNVEVFVSKDPDEKGSYIGKSQIVKWMIGYNNALITLEMQRNTSFVVNNIWGFPVQIEKLKDLGNNTFQASGSFINLPGNENFSVQNPNTRLDFKDVMFVKNPKPTPPGSSTGNSGSSGNVNSPFGNVNVSIATAVYDSHVPKDGYVTTLQNAISIKIYKKLQGSAYAYASDKNDSPRIFVGRLGNTSKAVIQANIRLDLASFKGAYQLSGDINLGEKKGDPIVTVLSSNDYPRQKFLLGQGNGSTTKGYTFSNLQYSVHEFKAEADVEKSYVFADSVKLFTILHTDIPTMTPGDIKLQAGYITVLPDKILPFEGGNDITFSLEKWKVTGQKPYNSGGSIVLTKDGTVYNYAWKYDKNNGGIVIQKAAVNTGVISVVLKNLIVKPDRLIADNLEMDKADKDALTLGGMVPLEILPKTQMLFTYDPNCYHDNKPHWKFSLLNPGGQAAQVSNLDGLDDGQTLAFESMNLFSDNQQQLSGSDSKKLVFKKVLNFSLTSIDVGPDYFTMVGAASMDIPNMSNGSNKISGQILYTKNSSGKAVFNFKPLYFNVEGAGKTSFQATDEASTQTLTSDKNTGTFTALGNMKIYDDKSGKSFTVKAKLFHQKTKNGLETYVEILPNNQFPLGKKYLDVVAGIANSGMRVKENNWDNLYLKTIMPNNDKGFQMVNDNPELRTLTLLVKGAILTDPDKGKVGIKGMDTGMGSISLFYDFDRGELRGNFFFKPIVPINVFLVNITSTNISMAIGENGFFIMNNGTGELALPGGFPLPAEGNVSTVMGYYTTALPEAETQTLLALAVQKSLPDFMENGIKGIYTSTVVSSEPLDANYDLTGDLQIPEWAASVKAWAYAGLASEYRSYINFTSLESFDYFSGVYSYGGAGIGGEATILGCGPKAGVKFDMQLNTSAQASPQAPLSLTKVLETIKSAKIGGCGSVGGTLTLGACLLGECLGFDLTKHISLHLEAQVPINGNKPLRIWCSLDDCGNAMPVKKLNESGY
jgi:TANFOR domain-containing protein